MMEAAGPVPSVDGILAEAAAVKQSSEALRLIRITDLVGKSRAFGLTIDDRIFAAAGLSAPEYWQRKLAEPMDAIQFARLLLIHLFDRDCEPEIVMSRLRATLQLAYDSGEDWLSVRPAGVATPGAYDLDKSMVRNARRGVEWMLSLPTRRDLIPKSLSDFIEAPPPRAGQPPMQYSKARLEAWYVRRVQSWPGDKQPPSRDSDWHDARTEFAGVSQDVIQELRSKHAPATWRARGRRRQTKTAT